MASTNTPTKEYPRLDGTPWWAWIVALLCGAGLNLALFVFMPCLLRSAPADIEVEKLVPQVQMVRLERPERPERPAPRKPPPPPPARKPPRAPKPALSPQAAVNRPRWPIDINPRPPRSPNSLALPLADLQPPPSSGLGDSFGVSDLDQPLLGLTRMPPVYPLTAKRRGIEGWVTVRFIVNVQGRVEEVTILDAQPEGIFESSVRCCVSGWRFQPGTVQGEAVNVWAETTIRFELD